MQLGSLIIVLALLLTACAPNLGEVRQRPPMATATYDLPAEDLAHCVLEDLRTDPETSRVLSHVILIPSHNPTRTKFFITGHTSSYSDHGIGYELSLHHADSHTTVELRQGALFQSILDDLVWPAIPRCAEQLRASETPQS